MELNLSNFKEFIATKNKFAQMYSNEITHFTQNNFRKETFNIKSHLTGDSYKDSQIYIALNFPRVITRTFTNYVVGKGVGADFSSEGDSSDNELNLAFVQLADQCKLQKVLNTAVNAQSSIGFGIVRARKDDQNKVRLENIPVTNYSANMEGLNIGDNFYDIKEHYIFSIFEEGKDKTKVMIVDRYQMQEDGTWKGFYKEKYNYSLNWIFDKPIQKAETEEELDILPIFLFNNDLENQHLVIDRFKDDKLGNIPRYFNQSDYVDLAPIFEELNDRISQISLEHIKNLTSVMSVPESFAGARNVNKSRPRGNKDDRSERIKERVEVVKPDFMSHGSGETPAQYITKDVGILSVALKEYLPTLLRSISAISTLPNSMLGLDSTIQRSPVGTVQKEFEPFYARVESKQQEIYGTLQRMFACMIYLEKGKLPDLPTIVFPKVIGWDMSERTEIAQMQMQMGLMSKESALQYIMGYDHTEAIQELEKVNKEIKNTYARNGGSLLDNATTDDQ